MISGIRAVIFDLDGTLVDSALDIATALNAALAAERRRALSVADVTRMIGDGAKTLVERALRASSSEPAPELVERVYCGFGRHYHDRPADLTKPYPGALEVIGTLKAHGIRLGVCTNKPQDLTDAVLKGLGLQGAFGSVVGARTGLALKPSAEMPRKVLQDLGVVPEVAVFVGDSIVDVRAARAAGMRSVVVSHGYTSPAPPMLGADKVIASLDELLAILEC